MKRHRDRPTGGTTLDRTCDILRISIGTGGGWGSVVEGQSVVGLYRGLRRVGGVHRWELCAGVSETQRIFGLSLGVPSPTHRPISGNGHRPWDRGERGGHLGRRDCHKSHPSADPWGTRDGSYRYRVRELGRTERVRTTKTRGPCQPWKEPPPGVRGVLCVWVERPQERWREKQRTPRPPKYSITM